MYHNGRELRADGTLAYLQAFYTVRKTYSGKISDPLGGRAISRWKGWASILETHAVSVLLRLALAREDPSRRGVVPLVSL